MRDTRADVSGHEERLAEDKMVGDTRREEGDEEQTSLLSGLTNIPLASCF